MTAGIRLGVDPGEHVGRDIYRGLYERAEVAVLPALVDPGGLTVDVGANIGYYSALLSALVGPAGRVVAFEPSPWCLPRLDAQVRDAGLDNVTVRPVALGDRDGSALLTNPGGASNLGQGPCAPPPAAGPGRPSRCRCAGSDGFPECGEGEIQLLKVDVEGLEEQVLAGGRRLFAERRVRAALLEVSPEFGPTDYAAALVGQLDGGYRSFRVCLRRRALRWQPALRPLPAGEVGRAATQFSLLLVRADNLHRVRRFVHWRTGRHSLRSGSVPPASGMHVASAD